MDAARQLRSIQQAPFPLAVLPFANLSGDASQEFFSDGMTEEITSALAKIPDLRVVARTSAFQFKGQNRDIRAIGQALNATHLIEGSVRKAGDRVRITAQLIKADNGVHIWTESYDRELTDMFAIQEDIARAIAGALRMPLGLKPGEHLVTNRAIDPQSYEQLLRAKALRGRGANPGPLQKRSVAGTGCRRDPDYAPAWGLLEALPISSVPTTAAVTNRFAEYARRVERSTVRRAKPRARRAIGSIPNLARGTLPFRPCCLDARGSHSKRRRALFQRAGARSKPSGCSFRRHPACRMRAGEGSASRCCEQVARASNLLSPPTTIATAQYLWLNGQNDAAIALRKDAAPNRPRAPALAGSTRRWAATAKPRMRLTEISDDPIPAAGAGRRVCLRTAPAKAALAPSHCRALPDNLEFVYALRRGARPRDGDLRRRVDNGFLRRQPNGLRLASLLCACARRSASRRSCASRARRVLAREGLADLCRPVGADDFACE